MSRGEVVTDNRVIAFRGGRKFVREAATTGVAGEFSAAEGLLDRPR
jgi:hypothetical protein